MRRDAGEDESIDGVLRRFGLSPIAPVDENETFLTLRCRDRRGEDLVVKYLRGDSPDARRRLRNEALLTRGLHAAAPLRLLEYRAHGPRFLLTKFDPGVLLRPSAMGKVAPVDAVADALVLFQSADSRLAGEIIDREPLTRYYLKVMVKHLLHLWPTFVTLGEAARCLGILTASLPAISRERVLCHGDFLPTNLLFHPGDGSVTVTDLEGSMRGNHPLFDVLALCTTDESPLGEWSWQPSFLGRYLQRRGPATPAPSSREFIAAYRGILTFFLVYRLNETRLHVQGTGYFDGLSKIAYLRRRLRELLPRAAALAAPRPSEGALEVRRKNLLSALDDAGFRNHFETMVEGGRRPIVIADGSLVAVREGERR